MVILHIIKNALLAGMALFFLHTPNLYAEEAAAPATGQEEIACNMDENTKKQLASAANDALKNLDTYYKHYKAALDKDFLNDSGVCNYLHHTGQGWFTEELKWGNYDNAGVTEAKKYEPDIETNWNKVSDHLSDTDYNVVKYKEDNSKNLSMYQTILSLAGADVPPNTKAQDDYGNTYSIRSNGNGTKGIYKNGSFEVIINGNISQIKERVEKYKQCDAAITIINNHREKMKEYRLAAHQSLYSLTQTENAQCLCTKEEKDSSGNITKPQKLISCEVKDESFKEDDIDIKACKLLSEYQSELAQCVLCNLFSTLLKATADLAQGAFDVLKDGLLKLLGLAFGIYLAYESLLLVGSPTQQTPGKFLTTVTAQGFKVAISAILLINSTEIYELIITPIVDGGLELGLSLIPGSSGGQIIDRYASGFAEFDSQNQYIPAEFLQKIMGTIKGFNEEAAKIPAIGRSLICNAWIDPIWMVLPHTSVLIEGAIVYVFGIIITLAVGFYLLDCVIELGLFCCLVPFFIACWPFKITTGYTKTGWSMLMNVFFNFIMMGIVIGVALSLTQQALTAGTSYEQLEEWLNANLIIPIQAAMQIGGMQMLMLVVCCLMALKMVKEVGNLANKFDSGAGISLGANLGGTLSSVATNAAKGTAIAAGGTALKAGGAIAEASGVKGAANAAKNKVGSTVKNVTGKMGIGSQAKSADTRSDKSDSNDNKSDSHDNKSDSNDNKSDSGNS